jgi:hypothetical protein
MNPLSIKYRALKCGAHGKIFYVAEAVIIAAQSQKNVWRVMCLSYKHDAFDARETPTTIEIDGILNMLVAWAMDARCEYPVYLQIGGTSRKQQKFMLACAFHSLREKGYKLEGV